MPAPASRPSVLTLGPKLAQLPPTARVFLLFHGRHSEPASMLDLARPLLAEGDAALIPRAANGSWYPLSLLSPVDQNEPSLSLSLSRITSLLALLRTRDIPASRVVLGGFSQGACLVAEFLTRNPTRYAAALLFTGALLGPTGTSLFRAGSFDRTPILLSASIADPYIPFSRVEETASTLRTMQANLHFLPRAPEPDTPAHTIHPTELHAAQTMLARSR